MKREMKRMLSGDCSRLEFALFLVLYIALMASVAYAADTKLSALTNLGTAPAISDELYLNDAGSSKALTVGNLFLYLGAAYDTEAELLALFAGKQGVLTNEAGLYAALSDVADFVQPDENVATATALAANGGNCSAGSYPLGVGASGAVESCTDATTEINSAIAATKLDDLTTPDDNTDLNASTSAHGLLPKLNNDVNTWLNGQGGWTAPAGSGDITAVGDCASGDCTAGIADNNVVQIDDADAADNDYAKITANGLEGRSYAEVLSDIGAAASTSDITAVGDCASGACTGDAILDNEAITPSGGTWDLSDVTLTLPSITSTDWVDDTDIDFGTGANQVSQVDIPGTAWRVTYTNGSGVNTELALGADGTVLQSNGASAAPTFEAAGGAETNSLETTVTGIADAEIFVGDGADSGAFVTVSGDATLANTGALTIANDAVETAMINTDAVTMDGVDADGDFTSLTGDWLTSGTIQGDIKTTAKSGNATLSSSEINGWVIVTATATITLADYDASDGTGTAVCIYSTTAAAIYVDPNAEDKIRLEGVLLDAGDKLTSESAAGDYVCLLLTDFSGDVAHWTTLGMSGAWSDGG